MKGFTWKEFMGNALNEAKDSKRWVYGNRDKKWHLVGSDDRDFKRGVSQEDFKKLGEKKALEKYQGAPSFIGAKNEGQLYEAKKKELSVPEKHQLNIAKKTLKMSDAGANVMGGMNKKEAREFLKKIGYTDKEIAKMEESTQIDEAKKFKNRDVSYIVDDFVRFLIGDRERALTGLRKWMKVNIDDSIPEPGNEYNQLYGKLDRKSVV
jgi:hypothetical protein